MKIQKLSARNVLFSFQYPEWNLHLHLILGKHLDFLIDTGMGRENVEPILLYRAQQHRTQELVIINTHYHFDHVWGNVFFENAQIIAHAKCPDRIVQDWDNAVKTYSMFWTKEVRIVLPNRLLCDEMHFPDEGIRIFAAGGHTPDGISVWDEVEGVLNVGDNIGDTMEQVVPELECSVEEYRVALAKYRALSPRYIVSGHNDVCTQKVLDLIAEKINICMPPTGVL